jgi:hypothetical protein
VDVEPLRLETGEAGGDGLEALANGIEMVQSLLKRSFRLSAPSSNWYRRLIWFDGPDT